MKGAGLAIAIRLKLGIESAQGDVAGFGVGTGTGTHQASLSRGMAQEGETGRVVARWGPDPATAERPRLLWH